MPSGRMCARPHTPTEADTETQRHTEMQRRRDAGTRTLSSGCVGSGCSHSQQARNEITAWTFRAGVPQQRTSGNSIKDAPAGQPSHAPCRTPTLPGGARSACRHHASAVPSPECHLPGDERDQQCVLGHSGGFRIRAVHAHSQQGLPLRTFSQSSGTYRQEQRGSGVESGGDRPAAPRIETPGKPA